jgi:hypothetical protein
MSCMNESHRSDLNFGGKSAWWRPSSAVGASVSLRLAGADDFISVILLSLALSPEYAEQRPSLGR